MSASLRLDLIVACGFNFMVAFFCGVQVALRLHDGNTKDGTLLTFAIAGLINLLIWAWQIQMLRDYRDEDEDEDEADWTNDEGRDDPWAN
jgi:hypothetical protein